MNNTGAIIDMIYGQVKQTMISDFFYKCLILQILLILSKKRDACCNAILSGQVSQE
jgi:hypothetical protein